MTQTEIIYIKGLQLYPRLIDGRHCASLAYRWHSQVPNRHFLSREINFQYYFTGILKTFIKVSTSNTLFAFKIKLYMAKPR